MLSTQSLFNLILQPESGVNLRLTNWEDSLFVLREAKLLATLYHSAKRKGCLNQYPDFAQKHLRSASVYASQQKLQVNFEAAELRELFEEIGVTALFLKGAGYALRDSLNSEGRICSDLDILVDKADLNNAEAHLRDNLWLPEALDEYDEKYYREWAHEIPPMMHLNRGTVIDMHHNLYLPISGRALDVTPFFTSREKTQSGCFVLEPSATVMHSIIHMFANEDSSSWMRDLVDITMLIQEYENDVFWEKLLKLAKQTKFEFEFVSCLYALIHYTDMQLPKEIQAYIITYPLTRLQKWLIHNAIIPAIAPEHEKTLSGKHRLAKQIVYFRGHWIKMPAFVLFKHFVLKSFFAIRDQVVGKNHFDQEQPKNPDW